MKITTNITKADLLKFNLRFMVTAPFIYKYFGVIVVCIFLYVAWSKGFPDSLDKWRVMIVGSLLGGFGATIIYSIWCIVSVLITSKNSNGLLGIHEYELREEGLFERTTANETLNRWEALGKVYVAGPNLLLQVSGFLYHVFPKRCFDSEEQFNVFKETLQEKVSSGHNK